MNYTQVEFKAIKEIINFQLNTLWLSLKLENLFSGPSHSGCAETDILGSSVYWNLCSAYKILFPSKKMYDPLWFEVKDEFHKRFCAREIDGYPKTHWTKYPPYFRKNNSERKVSCFVKWLFTKREKETVTRENKKNKK